ncbi:MAG: hypothetical protein CMK32_09665 [Porticoccaceae bacterium]|nr:hypothetical protein [Porticoccaceae bacterium]
MLADESDIISFGIARGRTIGELFDVAEKARPYHTKYRQEKRYLEQLIQKNCIAFSTPKLWNRFVELQRTYERYPTEDGVDYSDDLVEEYMGFGDFC